MSVRQAARRGSHAAEMFRKKEKKAAKENADPWRVVGTCFRRQRRRAYSQSPSPTKRQRGLLRTCVGLAWASPCPHPAHQHECTLLIKYKGVQRNPGGEKLWGAGGDGRHLKHVYSMVHTAFAVVHVLCITC